MPLGVGPLVKKPRPVTQTFTPLGRPSETDYRGSPTTQVYLYEEIATEGDAHIEFLPNFFSFHNAIHMRGFLNYCFIFCAAE